MATVDPTHSPPRSMRYYVPGNDDWTFVPEPPADPPYFVVDEEAPAVQFVQSSNSFFVEGAPARANDETVHTVALVDPSAANGLVLCALRAVGEDLTVEDRRPADARTQHADPFQQLQSALDEILIPVYIDDAVEEISESVTELVVLHTAQYDDPPNGSASYFRTSVFRDGSLLLEAERGSM